METKRRPLFVKPGLYAQLTQQSRPKVYAGIKDRSIPHVMINGMIRIPYAHVEYLQKLARQAMVDRSLSLGQIGKLKSAGVMSHLDAACLASRNIPALENLNLKAALAQLVRGTHAGDTTAEDDHVSRHLSPDS